MSGQFPGKPEGPVFGDAEEELPRMRRLHARVTFNIRSRLRQAGYNFPAKRCRLITAK
jgi:hypothetical protein